MSGTKRKREEQPPEPAAATAAAVAAALIASVLGNDDLLIEILLRLGSPAWFVRAALVCRRWLRLASDPALLRRFRARHPPRVLGLSVCEAYSSPKLFPFPQPPDLAAAARLAGGALETLGREDWVVDCRNGRLLVQNPGDWVDETYAVRSLLHAGRDEDLPPTPYFSVAGGTWRIEYFLLEDDDDPTSCLCLRTLCSRTKARAQFSFLRSGVWSAPRRSALMELSCEAKLRHKLLSGTKIYMITNVRSILVLDLSTATFSLVKLPDGAGRRRSLRFARAQQSGLYLIDAIGYKLRVWLWRGDGAEQWELVDTISVRKACDHLNVRRWKPDDSQSPPVQVVLVGDNAEFVIFELVASGIVCYMQLGNRVVEKVAWRLLEKFGPYAHPVTMVWPPIFPKLDKASEEH
ncbi:hypothetical protein ACP70R_042273 [Stipagrostis hirtigluma subsp. patula]